MKRHIAFAEINPIAIRAGVICSLLFGLYFITLGGLSDLPRVFGFIVFVAVCFVLIMKSVVDVLIWMVGFAARYCGMGLGHSVRIFRRLLLRACLKIQRDPVLV
jgi:hypothetical protein